MATLRELVEDYEKAQKHLEGAKEGADAAEYLKVIARANLDQLSLNSPKREAALLEFKKVISRCNAAWDTFHAMEAEYIDARRALIDKIP